MADTKLSRSLFEQHTQTALVLLLVALLLWVGSTTQSTALHVAEMKVEIVNLKRVISTPAPQYIEMTKRLEEHSARLNLLEGAVLQQQREQNK